MSTEASRRSVRLLVLTRWVFTAWFDRETALPLAVGTAVGLLLCVVALPASARMVLTSHEFDLLSTTRQPDEDETRQSPDRPDQVVLGDDEPDVAQVAWISHDDYQRLVAPRDRTEQPAVQMAADPVRMAPHRLDATAPAPGAVARRSRTALALGRRRPQRPDIDTSPDGTLPRSRPDDAVPPGETQAVQAQDAAPGQPTASPRSDREASAVSLRTDAQRVRAGKVITAEGVRIQTVAPRINAVTYLTAMRGGIRLPVRVMFDRAGTVTKAQLRKRTGYPEVDTPVRASLYRWRAGGKRLAEMDRPFQIDILLEIGGR